MAEDEKLTKYIERLLAFKNDLSRQSFSAQDLKHIAEELGFDETEWQKIQQIAENYYLNGQAFLAQQNWQDALSEFDKSLAINPHHEGSLLGKVQAYAALKQIRNKKSDEEQLKAYAQQLLQLKPGHSEVVRLLSQASPPPKKRPFFSSPFIIAASIVFMVALLGIYLLYPNQDHRQTPQPIEKELELGKNQRAESAEELEAQKKQMLYNEIIDKRENVYEQWAQVENVYQRRNDLISEVLSILKQSGQLEQALLDKVLEKQKALKLKKFNQYQNEGLQQFNRQQAELKTELKQLLQNFQNVSTLKGYRDLQVQIEGAENRIAVERRKYNRLVGDYNRMVQKQPYQQFNFETIAYFQQNTSP